MIKKFLLMACAIAALKAGPAVAGAFVFIATAPAPPRPAYKPDRCSLGGRLDAGQVKREHAVVSDARFREVDFVNNSTAAIHLLDNFILVGSGARGLQLGAQRYNGFFIGGGIEYAIDWWPGLVGKSEYRFADYRSATTSINCVNAALCGAFWVGPTRISERIPNYVQTVRTEL